MRVLTVLSVLVFVAACSSPAPAPTAPAADAPQVKGNLNQVMRGILFPNSNILFDAQDKDPGGSARSEGSDGGSARVCRHLRRMGSGRERVDCAR